MKYDPPMSEPEQLAELIGINVDFIPKLPCPTLRSEHGKGVADLTANFTVLDQIPDKLRVGLFAEPGQYQAIVRFSNGAVYKDNKRDTHGMAVKVLDVPMKTAPVGEDGQTFQDFIMLDSPVFVMGCLRDYIPFNRVFLDAKVSVAGKLGLAKMLLRNPRWIRPVLRLALNRPNAPLSTNYWSTTPYQLGGNVVKYKARPIGPALPSPRIKGPDGRRTALRQQLDKGPGLFAFGVLLQTDPATQPIEEPRIDWEKKGARFYPLAEIEIPPDQVVDAPAEMENKLSYSPGHAATEHFPLGALNRARVAIYSAASRARKDEVRKQS